MNLKYPGETPEQRRERETRRCRERRANDPAYHAQIKESWAWYQLRRKWARMPLPLVETVEMPHFCD